MKAYHPLTATLRQLRDMYNTNSGVGWRGRKGIVVHVKITKGPSVKMKRSIETTSHVLDK